MESERQPLYRFALKYGLIFAAIPTVYNILIYSMGLHLDYNYYGERLGEAYAKARLYLLPALLFTAFYFLRKTQQGRLKLSEALKLGLWILLISTFVVIGYNLIFRLVLEPDFSSKFYKLNSSQIYEELVVGHLEVGRDYTQQDMDNHVRTNGGLWNAISAYVFLNLVFTLIFSLILGMILKKKSVDVREP